jgi:hypothetical protein
MTSVFNQFCKFSSMKKQYDSKKPFFKRAFLTLLTLAFLGIVKSNAQVSLTASTGTTTGTYTTLNDAFAAINAGTHKGTIAISITANTTEPSSVTPLYGSGTASASSSSYTSVTIKPSGGNWTINSAASPTANRGLIELAGADNVTIDGDDASTTGTRNLTIAVATGTTATAAVRISSNSTLGSDGADNVTVKNCNIAGSRTGATATNINYGIVGCNFSTTSLTGGAYNSQNTTIENNNITRTYRAVYLLGASTTYPNTGLIIRNNIIGSSTAADNIGQYGIYCTYTSGSTTSTTNNAIIEGNDIQVGDYTTGVSTTIAGIYLSSYNYGMIIRRNNIHDIANSSTSLWGSYGIGILSSLNNDINIENNFIRDVTNNSNSATPAYVYQNHGIYISSIGTGTKITHNTVYLNKANVATYSGGAYASTASSGCLTITSSSTSISQLYNNIFINNQGGISSNAYGIVTSGTTNLPASTNNNNIYAPSSGKVGYYSGSAIATLSAWQSTTGLDGASISEAVSFTSATDLHIPTGTTSLCESGGVSTSTSGVTVDFDNTTRPGTSTYGFGTAPDIGADEFNGQVVYTCATPAPGATISTPSTICFGQSVTLTLTTATAGTGVSYQWQSSPNGVLPYTNILGATASSLTITPTGPTFYRCAVTCKNGPVTTNSTPVQVAYSNNVLSSTSNVRCGTGTVSLAATGSAGSTLRWYNTATGGAAIASGSPFITPLISATTNYFVGAETITSGVAQIGTGASFSSSFGYPTAFGNYWYQDWQQIVYTAAELNAAGIGAGNITALAMNISGLPSPGSVSGYNIRIGATSASTLSSFTTTGLTTVFGPSAITPTSGWNTITFTTPFNWDGTSNIIVDIRGDGAYGSANATTQFSTTSGNTCLFAYSFSSAPITFFTSSPTPTATTSRPNIRFTGNLVCSSPRVMVTATVNTPPSFGITGTQTICNNATAAMSVSSTLSSFNTYTWSPASGLFTDAAATVAYTAGTSASTVYYKSTTPGATKYTCTANNASTLCAATDTAWITNLPSSMTTIATPSNICFSGNTQLTFSPTASLGAAQFQWQSSADNSTWGDSTGMTGMTLNTPTLSNTRYYRVVLRNGSGAFCLNATSDTALVLKPSVATVTGAVRCAPGSVTLGATGIDGTINWFDVSTGGTSLGSGNSFTTPSIASTTTYFAEVRATPDISATIGTGTTAIGSSFGGTGLTPFSQYYESARTQYLITAADISAAGLTAGSFGTMAFNVSTKSSTKLYNGYTIGLANTTATSLATGFLAPTFTTVYGPASYNSASGSNVFPLTGGFAWDGTSNIVVQVCFSNATGAYDGYTSNDAVSGTSKSYTSTYGIYEDNAYLCTGPGSFFSTASSSVLPNITFTRQGCLSSRSPVVATINPLPVPTISPVVGPIQICAGNFTTFTGGGGGNYQWRDATGLISGATSSTFTTGTAGSYRVIVTNPTTGCKDSSVAVAVNVNPVPTVSIAPALTTAICADSSQKLTSIITGTGLTYQWFRGGTAIASATTDSLRVNTSGVYSLRVYLGSCSDTSNDATIVVNPLPTSSFTKTGTTGAICLGSTLELTALSIPTTSSYQWSRDGIDIPGATSQKYNAAIGGVYTVRIKDNNNCRKTSDTMKVINTPMGVPNLLPKDLRFCVGTVVKLYANAGPFADSFAWTKNGLPLTDTTASIETGDLGYYAVTVTDIYGCTLTSTTSTITVDPLPIKPVINKIGSILSTANPYASYQWYRNGKIIVGATSRSYTISFDGDYHVVVTSSQGCKNISDVLSVQNLSVKQIARDGVKIDLYPNPAQSMINIDAPIDVNLVIRDIQGKQIMELKNAQQVDMSAYADGIYIFTLTDKEGVVVKMDKVVKRTN